MAEADRRRQDGDDVRAAVGVGLAQLGVEVAGVAHEITGAVDHPDVDPGGAEACAAAVASVGRSTRWTRARGA